MEGVKQALATNTARTTSSLPPVIQDDTPSLVHLTAQGLGRGRLLSYALLSEVKRRERLESKSTLRFRVVVPMST